MLNIEEVKRQKDGLLVLHDIEQFSQNGFASLSAEDLARLRWVGLFARETTPGRFMLRIRVPGGVLTIPQWMTLGQLAERYGQSVMDITTRQGVQLRWIQIEDVPAIFSALSRVDMSPLQTGFDNVRNVMSCPMAGIDLREWRIFAMRFA